MTIACPECGARYEETEDDCFQRFDRLLALDHSREEPWGSRHGLAFAAFALQHPKTPRYQRALEGAWFALCSVYLLGQPPSYVFNLLRAGGGKLPELGDIPERPDSLVETPAVSIRDLGDFDAASYPDRLADWCRATLRAWGIALMK
jgi:hypothetical protein